jgi:hypothetical protein
MSGLEVEETEFHCGAWVSRLPGLLALPRKGPDAPNGALQIAPFLLRAADF